MFETAEAEHEESRRERTRSRPNAQTKRLDGNKTGPEQQQTSQVHATSKEEVSTNTSNLVTSVRHLRRLGATRRAVEPKTFFRSLEGPIIAPSVLRGAS